VTVHRSLNLALLLLLSLYLAPVRGPDGVRVRSPGGRNDRRLQKGHGFPPVAFFIWLNVNTIKKEVFPWGFTPDRIWLTQLL